MTREIAKRIVKGITDKIECNTADIDDWAEFWGFSREEYEEFLDMPIKTLEQEPTYTSQIAQKAYEDGKKDGYVQAKLEQEPTTKNDSSELEKNSKLEKIRDQLKSNLRGVEITLEVLVKNDPLRPKMEGAKSTLEDCLELIDKVETEDT